MDSELAGALAAGGTDARVAMKGFARMFYPDAREFSSAARIKVTGGEQATANMTLTEEPFHLVRATVRWPGDRAPGGQGNPVTMSPGSNGLVSLPETFSVDGSMQNAVTVEVSDTEGHRLEYQGQYDNATHIAQAMLPDGVYLLRVTSVGMFMTGGHGPLGGQTALAGQAEVAVADHPVTKLQISASPISMSPIQATVMHSESASGSAAGKGIVFISVSQAGSSNSDGMNAQLAEGEAPGTLATNWMGPGAYWVNTVVGQAGMCESSFTAGGASLAREPLVVNQGGTTAPLTLMLRDDCGTLKLSLPTAGLALAAGEERAYTVYVVPDFDSTTTVNAMTLRPSSGASQILNNLTPGNYHIYTFAAPVELEYRNPEVMAGLTGQAVTVSPGTTQEIVLEVPAT
jgi:hypothetical protein